MGYKWCIVPQCTNTTIKTPDKLFVSVSKHVELRKKWLTMVRRDPNELSANSNIFCCEDHFDMEKDMANYIKYKMGFTKKIFLKEGVLPSKFDCQECHRKRLRDASSQTAYEKRQKLDCIQDCEESQLINEITVETNELIDDNMMQPEKQLECMDGSNGNLFSEEIKDVSELFIKQENWMEYCSEDPFSEEVKIVSEDILYVKQEYVIEHCGDDHLSEKIEIIPEDMVNGKQVNVIENSEANIFTEKTEEISEDIKPIKQEIWLDVRNDNITSEVKETQDVKTIKQEYWTEDSDENLLTPSASTKK